MRLDDDQDLTLPELLESARSFPPEVTTPDPDITTGLRLDPAAEVSLAAVTIPALTIPAITIPECCISLVDGPLVGLSTSDELRVSLDREGTGPLAGPGLLDGPSALDAPKPLDQNLPDAQSALNRGLVEGISAGTRP